MGFWEIIGGVVVGVLSYLGKKTQGYFQATGKSQIRQQKMELATQLVKGTVAWFGLTNDLSTMSVQKVNALVELARAALVGQGFSQLKAKQIAEREVGLALQPASTIPQD